MEKRAQDGIGATIAFFNLKAFASGDINVDSVLHGIVLADVLGYRSEITESGKTVWYDGNGAKVTGIMAVFADCTIDSVGTKINTVCIGDLIGYESDDNGVWYSTNEETGEREKVSGFMSKIADSSINNIGNIFDTLVIGDIVNEADRESGLFAIIPADTKIDEIGSAVNDSIMKSPLQFFINEQLITFEAGSGDNKQDMSATLDALSNNDYAEFYTTDEDFETQKGYYEDVWTEVKDESTGEVLCYRVANWRTQPLSSSFAYIIMLITSATPEIPEIPDIPVDDIPDLPI